MLHLFIFASLLQYVFSGCPEGYRSVDSDCVPTMRKSTVCFGHQMDIKCLPNNRIRILHVAYGRFKTKTCPWATHDTFTNCTIDKTDIFKQTCDGKQTCVGDPPARTYSYDPCFGTYKYLTIEYVCEYKQPTTTCEGLSSNLLCPGTDVLRINSAQWGRTTQKCPHAVYDTNKKCTPSLVTDTIKQRCEGMNQCFIEATTNFLGGRDPCPGTYKYLEIDYDCVSRIKNVKVCDDADMSLTCPVDFIIKVQIASYGRHDHFECRQKGNDYFIACGADETDTIKQVCDGEQSCNKPTPPKVFEGDP